MSLASWETLYEGEVAPAPDDAEPAEYSRGWQYIASDARNIHHRQRIVLPLLDTSSRALLRSQSGPQAGRFLTTLPTAPDRVITPEEMQVLLRRRLRLRLPMSVRRCGALLHRHTGRRRRARCNRRLDRYGDHGAACPVSGRFKKRAIPIEHAWARVFREAGARVERNKLRETPVSATYDHEVGEQSRLQHMACLCSEEYQ